MDQISILEDQAHHFFLTSMICLQEEGSSTIGERDRTGWKVGKWGRDLIA